MTVPRPQNVPNTLRFTLIAAAIYNLLWGGVVVIAPNLFFDLIGAARPNYPGIWQCVGMIVGVYGIGYAIAAADPLRHWPIVLVGLIGKLLGPIGFLDAAMRGMMPWSFGWIIVTNDLIWWIPFVLILLAAFKHAATRGEPDDAPRMPFADAIARFRANTGQTLAELSDGRDVLVVFLRHLGCTFCREALDDLSARRHQFRGRGTQLVLVHMSADAEAFPLFASYDLADVPRISDPERTLYRAFGLDRGSLAQLFGPRVWRRGAQAALRGHGVGRLAGDGFQMPGAFVLRDGRIVASHVHQAAGDRPDYLGLACAAAGACTPGGTAANSN